MAGAVPENAGQVNAATGGLLRRCISLRDEVKRYNDFMLATNLQSAPYSMNAQDEANIKSAVDDWNDALQAINLTFTNRLTGLF